MIQIRRAGACSRCGLDLRPGDAARWDPTTKALTCPACVGDTGGTSPSAPRPIDRGVAGRSAVRRHQSLHDRRERAVREAHPWIGGLILRATNDPQSIRAWATGGEGERLIGVHLDAIDENVAITLHDRRIPRSRANIDHITVARSGVFVIDSKCYSGRLELGQRGPFWAREARLYVGRRDKTKLVDDMARQTNAVRAVIQPLLEEFALPLTPVLCFIGVEVALFTTPFELKGVAVEWPKTLRKRIEKPGPLAPPELRLFARKLEATLPPA